MNNKSFKIKHIVFCLVSVLVAVGIFVLLLKSGNGTLKIANDTKKKTTLVAAPQFSAESGFYNKPFELKIKAPKGTVVYYTLNSTEPNENSALYKAPVLLKNATNNKNNYCMRTDVSAGFRTDLIEKYQTTDKKPGYVVPDYLVDKCNVVRAVAIDRHGNKSEIVTKVYFVGLDASKYNNCNIISVTTDPRNLFDYKKGIYVTGATFDYYMLNKDIGQYWRFWGANYRNKGSEWERKADITFFDSTGNMLLSQYGGIRVQGGVSRGALPRSLNLYAKNEYGKENFNFDFFGNDFYSSKLTLAGGGNRTDTQFNDLMMAECTASLNFGKMDFRDYVLFLDGEYWGFYRLCSAYDKTSVAGMYGVEADDIIMIKNGQLEEGKESQSAVYHQMLQDICDNDLSLDHNYEKACELVDIDSFTDYYATQIYISRQEDWPSSNYALWRTESNSGKPYADGKWRWLLFDSNSTSMKKEIIDHNTLAFVIEKDKLFASFWQNAKFRAFFQKRILEIADTCFNRSKMDAYIDDYIKEYEPIMEKSWKRFYGKDNNKREEFYNTLSSNKAFFDNRKAVVESWFK